MGDDSMTTRHAFPEPIYTVATAERDGLPAVAILNLAYNEYEFCADYPWLLSITIEIVGQSDEGLPTDEEGAVLNQMEDTIEAVLADITPFHNIARQTWNGQRVLDYYVQFGDKARACIESLSQSPSIPRGLKATIERDSQWAAWLPMLQAFECS
jgi:hypothetical protein